MVAATQLLLIRFHDFDNNINSSGNDSCTNSCFNPQSKVHIDDTAEVLKVKPFQQFSQQGLLQNDCLKRCETNANCKSVRYDADTPTAAASCTLHDILCGDADDVHLCKPIVEGKRFFEKTTACLGNGMYGG